MFLIKKEVEKPNYAKIVGITLGIIAGIAAVGAALYYLYKRLGLSCYFCRKADCEGCDYAEDIEEDEGFSDDENDNVEVEVENLN